jgi:2-hydroxy-3-oxopropionate reductase
MNVAFVGLGIMGRPMALNLIKAGFSLTVHARRAASMQPLLDAGARGATSPADAARGSDVIITMVSDTPDVEDVVLGAQGIVHGIAAGALVVDMSTIAPGATRRIASALQARGADLVDAPVSGGEAGAIAGTLSIMAGGSDAAFARVRPLFEAMGKNIVHVGSHGAGQVAKSCNQTVVALTIQAVAEAMQFARANGVDAAKVRAALLGGFAGSKILEVHGQRMLDGNYQPGFKARLHQKDLRIVLETATALNLPMPGTALVAQQMNALVGAGDGELDSSALLKTLERATRA